jgi:hypothetical protein
MAIADPGRQVDGFLGLPAGMDSSKAPNLIQESNYALGVNVVARGGQVKTRPGFVQLDLQPDPEDPDALVEFENSYFQGAALFTRPDNRESSVDLAQGGKGKTFIIVAASGWIFRIDPQTKKIVRINGTPGIFLSPVTMTALSGDGATVTVTTSTGHFLNSGDVITVAGCTAAGFNVVNTAVTSVISPTSFTYAASVSGSASVVGTYTINVNSQGYRVLPRFMDTTYYTLKITGAGKVTDGAGITGSSKVTVEDPHPTGVTLGLTGSGFEATAIANAGALSYATVGLPGSGFSKNAVAQVQGGTNAFLSLRFARDGTAAARPWPDRNHQVNRHYFTQAEKFLIIQDGVNPPFIFDGEYLRRAYATNPAVSMGQGAGTVTAIRVTHRGSGYTSAPTVTLTGSATATANINPVSGQLESVSITNPGSGYLAAPVVSFSGGGGSGAKAYAILNNPPEIPTGSVMSYGQGRLFVANPARFEIQAMDLVGSHVNKTAGKNSSGETVYPLSDPRLSVLFNTEDSYLGEGGSLLMPTFVGRITGMQFLPVQDVAAGQGQLYVFCEFGAASFAVSIPRTNWGTVNTFQQILYRGIGAVGPDAFAQVNGDLFFRSDDGIRTYRNATASLSSFGNTAMSAEMDLFLKNEPIHLLYNTSLAFLDEGRVLMTAQPREYQPATINSESRLVYRALVSLDFNTLNTSFGKSSAAYDGIWTGLDFYQVLAGDFGRRDRGFILARSCEKNGCWEIDPSSYEDRPIAGSEIIFSADLLSGVAETNAFISGTHTAQIPLADQAALNSQNLKFVLTTENESAATGWTSAGMGTQGVTLSFVTSTVDAPANTIFADSNLSVLTRSQTVLYPTADSGQASMTVNLGPLRPIGFLYVKVEPVGTLPAGNSVFYSVDYGGDSSGSVPIRAELETKSFGFSSGFQEKRLIRADVWLSNLRDQTEVEVYYKPDQYPSWIFWDEFTLLPQTTINILALEADKITKTNVSSQIAAETYAVDLEKYSTRVTRSLGVRMDFATGVSPAGTGAAPYQINVSYRISNLTPAQKAALVAGTPAYDDFYNNFRSVDVVIPVTQTAARYFVLDRPQGQYLYITLTYPPVLYGGYYDLILTPFGLDQSGSAPDTVVSSGFLSQLENLKPQYLPQVRLMNPQEQADPITNRLFSHGYEFQARLVWTGNVTLQKFFLHCQSLVEQVGGNAK